MSNLSSQCIISDCPTFSIQPSGMGIDQESGKVNNTLRDVIKKLKDSEAITFRRLLGDMHEFLVEIVKECSSENWDGYGAHAITGGAYEEAKKIINILPSSIPAPELVPEPNGEIGFEWRKGKGRVFVISVGGNYLITYAGIFFGNKVHGSEYFEDNFPFAIRQYLRRLYS